MFLAAHFTQEPATGAVSLALGTRCMHLSTAFLPHPPPWEIPRTCNCWAQNVQGCPGSGGQQPAQTGPFPSQRMPPAPLSPGALLLAATQRRAQCGALRQSPPQCHCLMTAMLCSPGHPAGPRKATCCLFFGRGRKGWAVRRALQPQCLFQNPAGSAPVFHVQDISVAPSFYPHSCLNGQSNAREVFAGFSCWTVISSKCHPYSPSSAQRIACTINPIVQEGLNRKKSNQQAHQGRCLTEISQAAITHSREVNVQGCNLEGSCLNKSTVTIIRQKSSRIC